MQHDATRAARTRADEPLVHTTRRQHATAATHAAPHQRKPQRRRACRDLQRRTSSSPAWLVTTPPQQAINHKHVPSYCSGGLWSRVWPGGTDEVRGGTRMTRYARDAPLGTLPSHYTLTARCKRCLTNLSTPLPNADTKPPRPSRPGLRYAVFTRRQPACATLCNHAVRCAVQSTTPGLTASAGNACLLTTVRGRLWRQRRRPLQDIAGTRTRVG